MNQINSTGPIGGSGGIEKRKAIESTSPEGTSFKETLKTFMSDVNDIQQKADVSIQKMVSGEINDVHQVMTSVEEANTAFNMMMEIRNKVLEAYQEVMRIRL